MDNKYIEYLSSLENIDQLPTFGQILERLGTTPLQEFLSFLQCIHNGNADFILKDNTKVKLISYLTYSSEKVLLSFRCKNESNHDNKLSGYFYKVESPDYDSCICAICLTRHKNINITDHSTENITKNVKELTLKVISNKNMKKNKFSPERIEFIRCFDSSTSETYAVCASGINIGLLIIQKAQSEARCDLQANLVRIGEGFLTQSDKRNIEILEYMTKELTQKILNNYFRSDISFSGNINFNTYIGGDLFNRETICLDRNVNVLKGVQDTDLDYDRSSTTHMTNKLKKLVSNLGKAEPSGSQKIQSK